MKKPPTAVLSRLPRLSSLCLLCALAPLAAQAESNIATATSGTLSASAKLNFQITVPKVLYLQVGTGTPATLANNATVDTITFAVPGASNGNGTVIAGTGGDLGGADVTIRVLGNSGTVSLSNSTTGPLSSGVAGNPTVNWSDITVTAGPLGAATPGYTNAAIVHPAFVTGGPSTSPTSLTATGGLVRREGKWTFAYANTTMLPAGTYGNANGGVATYTATAP